MCHLPDGKYPRGESHYGYFGFRNPADNKTISGRGNEIEFEMRNKMYEEGEHVWNNPPEGSNFVGQCRQRNDGFTECKLDEKKVREFVPPNTNDYL
jgi:hypothetical protein